MTANSGREQDRGLRKYFSKKRLRKYFSKKHQKSPRLFRSPTPAFLGRSKFDGHTPGSSPKRKLFSMSEASILFQLLPEIRNEIYGHLLAGWHNVPTWSTLEDGTTQNEDDGSDEWLRSKWHRSKRNWWIEKAETVEDSDVDSSLNFNIKFKPDYSILRVCRRTYEEASNILYTYGRFNFGFKVSQLRDQGFLGIQDLQKSLHRVRSLRLSIADDKFSIVPTAAKILQMLRFFADRASSLEELEIAFYFSPCDFQRHHLLEHELLDNFGVQMALLAFNVKRKIELLITHAQLSGNLYEKWSLAIAKRKDWVVSKNSLSISYPRPETSEGNTVKWTVVPRYGKWLEEQNYDTTLFNRIVVANETKLVYDECAQVFRDT